MEDINVEYVFYTDTYKGYIIPDSTSFDKYIKIVKTELLSRIEINLQYVNEEDMSVEQIASITEKLKKCLCELADFEYRFGINRDATNDNKNKEISSETVGSISRTYVTKTSVMNNNIYSQPDKFKQEIIRKHLRTTGLLYGGI